MARILTVPGLGGSGPEHWQTWLERSLPGTGRVEQDDWDRPHRDKWLARLVGAVAEAPGAVLVAHSLGCILVAHAAREYPALPIGRRCWSRRLTSIPPGTRPSICEASRRFRGCRCRFQP
jgi:uncharacterized protein